jgi:hypothetical protein
MIIVLLIYFGDDVDICKSSILGIFGISNSGILNKSGDSSSAWFGDLIICPLLIDSDLEATFGEYVAAFPEFSESVWTFAKIPSFLKGV